MLITITRFMFIDGFFFSFRQKQLVCAHNLSQINFSPHAKYGIVNGPCGSTATRASGPNFSNRSFTAAPMS